MKNYISPDMEITKFEVEDVITTSNDSSTGSQLDSNTFDSYPDDQTIGP